MIANFVHIFLIIFFASVKDLWKALKIKDSLNNLLDEAAS
jgi:hypothetical protein